VPQGATSSHTSILRQSPLEAKDIPYTGIRKKIGERLLTSTQNIPSFAYVDEIRMDKVEALRQELKGMASEAGVKLTPLTFVLKAVTLALQSFPQLNSRLNDAQTLIHQHANIHLGVAVDAPQGLVVPVISNAEHLHLFEIAKRVQELGTLAKDGKLKPQQMQGGTFTVSSIGSIGGLLGIPIINAPEVAILGVNALRKVAVVNDRDEIVVGKVLNLSISADHRVVDGADAARFVNLVKSLLESPAQLLL
jgi:pyruvate/2-oxoglutarate dehydrogenase complex dihydrolipoamide acyltransferase (E2) component